MKKNNILRKAGFLLFFLFFSHLTMAQAIGDFRSIGNGNWNTTATWQTYSGTTWVSASAYPGQNAGTYSVSVSSGTTVTVSVANSYSFGNLTVSGTLALDNSLTLPTTPSVYITATGQIKWTGKKVILKLASGVSLVIEPGSQGLTDDGGSSCSNNSELQIGSVNYAVCVGGGGIAGTFNDVNVAGGTFRADVTDYSICTGNPLNIVGGYTGAISSTTITYDLKLISGPGGTFSPSLPAQGTLKNGTTITNPKTLTTLTNPVVGTYQFQLMVSDNGSPSFTNSKNFTVTVSPGVSAGTVAFNNSSICIGSTATASSNGNSGGVWSSSNISVATVNSSTGVVTGVAGGTATITYTLNSGCGTPKSASAVITVNPNVAITSQSTASQTKCITAAFSPITVTATGVGLNYQWYSNTSNSSSGGTSLGVSNGAQTSSYTPQSSVAGTLYYYCVVSGTCGTAVTSAVSGAFVTNLNVSIASQSTVSQAQCFGAAFSPISVTATGTGLSFQWYSNVSNSNSGGISLGVSNGAQTSGYTPQSSVAGTLYYYCVVSGTCGTAVTSAVSGAFVTNPNVSIASQSTLAQTQCIGTAFSPISVTATGTGLSYQWYSNGANSNSGGISLGAISGAQTSSYTPQSTVAGTLYYYCVVSGGCGTAVTSAVSGAFITNPILNASVNIASSATAVCAGSSVTFTATPTNGGTPAYQWKVNGNNVGTNSATYTTTALNNNDQVTVIMTSNASPCMTGSPVTSNIITMTVNALPTVSVTGNNRICKNTDAVFNLTGTPGATVNYNINSGSNSTVVLAGGTALVKVPAASVNQTLSIVSVSNGTCTNSAATSATVMVGEDSVYTGTWSKGLPNGNGLNAVIAGNYNTSAGDIKACSCTILSGGSLTVGANHFLEVDNAVTNNGTLTIESDGNLIQNVDSPSPANSGNITVKRNIKFRNDSRQEYNYLISPVIGQSLKTIYPGVPTTATYPYVLYYNEANNYFYNSSGAYIAGRGLAVKEPTKADVPADNMDAVFNGVPGNGVISFPLAHTNNVQNGYNLVGNPYPSNIDLQKLYLLNGGATASPKISSTFQFWDNGANNIYTQQGSGYNGRAYAVYNAANNTGNAAGYLLSPSQILTAKVPNETAKVGQGFMVRATGGGNLVFNNDIRSNNTGAGFFSKGTQSSADRYWLKLVTPVNAVNTIAVVYFDGGSNTFGMDDSGMNGDSSDMLYSLAEGNKLQIEGKPMFDVSDKIILGSRHFAAGNYTFALDKAEGVFANGQHIYLKDKQTGIITNLSEGSYTFAANAGESTGRFEIIYQSETVLATDGTVKDDLFVYRDGDDFVIDSKGKKITQVEVYDSSGRLSLKTEPGSLKAVIPAISLSNGVYILKINQAGKITNRKIIR